jgi:serine/threonine protein kinase
LASTKYTLQSSFWAKAHLARSETAASVFYSSAAPASRNPAGVLARVSLRRVTPPLQVKLCENAGGVLFAVKICRCSFAKTAQLGGRRGSLRPQASNSLHALKKEISIMKRLDHPNIVKLHYILEDHVKCKVPYAPPLHFNAPPARRSSPRADVHGDGLR